MGKETLSEGEGNTRQLTSEVIEEQTGHTLIVSFPRWQSDKAGVVGFHDELERLGQEYGWVNVIGSLYYEEGNLVLGIFMAKDVAPPEVQPLI